MKDRNRAWVGTCLAFGFSALILVIWTSGLLDWRRLPGVPNWPEIYSLQRLVAGSPALAERGLPRSVLLDLMETLPDEVQVFAGVNHRARIKADSQEQIVNLHLLVGDYFDSLGVSLIVGTAPEWASVVPQRQVLISERIWREFYDSDPAVVGRSLEVAARAMDGREFLGLTVIGVVAEDFRGLEYGLEEDLWLPFSDWPNILLPDIESTERVGDILFSLRAGVRLPENIDVRQIETLIRLVVNRHQSLMPGQSVTLVRGFGLHPDHRALLFQQAHLFRIVGFILAIVLMIGYVLWMSLQVVRNRRDDVIRMILGEKLVKMLRRRAYEQVRILIPSLLAGVLFAVAITWMFYHGAVGGDYRPVMIEYFSSGAPWRAGLVPFTVAVFLALVVVLMHGMTGRRLDLSSTGRAGQQRQYRLPFYLGLLAVTAMTAIALGEQHRLGMLNSRDMGFKSEDIAVIQLDGEITRQAVMDMTSTRNVSALLEEFRRAVAEHPQVNRMAFSTADPLGEPDLAEVKLKNPQDGTDIVAQIGLNEVSPEYFDLLSLQLLEGRAPHDRSVDEVVINKRFEDLFLGGLGKTLDVQLEITSPRDMGSSRTARIVGVVEDAQFASAISAATATLYRPLLESGAFRAVLIEAPEHAWNDVHEIVFRVHAQAGQQEWQFQPARSLEDKVSSDLSGERQRSASIWLLFLIVGLLGSIGLISAVRQWVDERALELAVRQALGAKVWQLLAAAMGIRMHSIIVLTVVGTVLSAVLIRTSHPAFSGATSYFLAVAAVFMVVLLVTLCLVGLTPSLKKEKLLAALKQG